QWATDWGQATTQTGPTYNVKLAACRPATLLNHIYNRFFTAVKAITPSAGMCAQGFSAGSAAIAYSLAWYGGGDDLNRVYLDKVELLSGPVLSDIKQGCDVPSAEVCACGNPITGVGSPWCQLSGPGGTQPPWFAPISYSSEAGLVRNWT